MGVRPPYLLSLTKLAGKIFFPAYSNNLIYKNIFSSLNRWRTIAIVFLLGIFWGGVVGSVSAQVIETVNLPAVQKTGGMSLMEALQNRQSQRSFSSKELSLQQMSNLLWAAYGINRPNGYRTVPSACISLVRLRRYCDHCPRAD